MKIVVLCGGLSMERDVSVSSGTLICRALRDMGHKAVLVDMFYGLEDVENVTEGIFEALEPLKDAVVACEAPDMEKVKAARKWKSRSAVGKGVFELCALADLVFLALHGECGEDGRIQAALDLLGVPYTGSGCLPSALAMDKHLTKQMAAAAGVRTPKWETVRYEAKDIPAICERAFLPCVVKPVDSGSSIGVSIANTKEELSEALTQNLGYRQVMLEQYIRGREIDVAVLDGVALPSIEIIPKALFYDYKSKYQPGETVEICPAPIDAALEAELREMAVKVHNALGLGGYSRSDYMVDANGKPYFIEVNTLPGMTPTSLMPQEAAAVGIDYNMLCERIIELALRKGDKA